MPITSATQFIEALQQSGLLEPDQLTEITQRSKNLSANPSQLGNEIVERGWLTGFQLEQLLANQGLVFGSYALLEPLGAGGMGQVYKARHRKLKQLVALKVVRKERLSHPDAARRFRREIQALSQLAHPNIVRALDADEADGVQFFAMEFVDGTDLARLVKQRGPLPIPEACDCIRQAALALEHASQRGLVHPTSSRPT
jgi:serine/threonine protein kinase